MGARRGLGHVALALVAVGLSLPVMVATQPGQASSDVACAALLLAGVALLLHSDLRPVRVGIAGLAVGLTLSTKISVAPAVAALVLGVAVLTLWKRQWRSAVTWAVTLVITGSFWFLRDWRVAGTPLPWFDLKLGPIDLPRQIPPTALPLAHDVTNPDAWRLLYLDGIWQGFGRAWPVVVAVLVAVTIGLIVRRDPVQRLLGLVLAAGVIGYVFTPLTGGFGFVFNLRYLSPELLVAFALLPLVLPSTSRWRWTLLGF